MRTGQIARGRPPISSTSPPRADWARAPLPPWSAVAGITNAGSAIAAEQGVLNIRYAGTGVIDGRPTFVIVRDLPYSGPRGPYPDARMVLHLDQEWLLPVAVRIITSELAIFSFHSSGVVV